MMLVGGMMFGAGLVMTLLVVVLPVLLFMSGSLDCLDW